MLGFGKITLGAVDQKLGAKRILPLTLRERFYALAQTGKKPVGIRDRNEARAAMIHEFLRAVRGLASRRPVHGVTAVGRAKEHPP